MNIEEIKALIETLKDTEYSYIKIKNKDTVIELGKESDNGCCGGHHGHMMYPQMMQQQTPMQPQVAPVSIGNQVITSASEESSAVQAEDPSIYTVKSPIVGTYYASSSPEADPFVKVGDSVKANQTICIIEAMKLMNEIEAEVNGVIVEILVRNEDPIEYGQPLFKIKKA